MASEILRTDLLKNNAENLMGKKKQRMFKTSGKSFQTALSAAQARNSRTIK
jgi:hypothetical protein